MYLVDTVNANNMEEKAIQLVKNYFRDKLNTILNYEGAVFVVWSCFILGNRKYMIGTDFTDHYFEVTYKGSNGEWYIDVYDKIDTIQTR